MYAAHAVLNRDEGVAPTSHCSQGPSKKTLQELKAE